MRGDIARQATAQSGWPRTHNLTSQQLQAREGGSRKGARENDGGHGKAVLRAGHAFQGESTISSVHGSSSRQVSTNWTIPLETIPRNGGLAPRVLPLRHACTKLAPSLHHACTTVGAAEVLPRPYTTMVKDRPDGQKETLALVVVKCWFYVRAENQRGGHGSMDAANPRVSRLQAAAVSGGGSRSR
jgi:hypothetical protein